MSVPIRSFNRKHSHTYNERIRGRQERREKNRKKIDPNEHPIDHSGNSYLAARFLETELNNGGFLDGAELREELSRYVGTQGGYTPPLSLVKQKLSDRMFSTIVRMSYYDEPLREYLEQKTLELDNDLIY